jgi:nucleoside-diphosphate-sugar epimerase
MEQRTPYLVFEFPCDINRWSENGAVPFFHPKLWYGLAKVFAEKAAWEFAKENGIDLVTVLPSFVIGPSLSHELCVTASDVLGLFQGTHAPSIII